jgi:hypothetical protein
MSRRLLAIRQTSSTAHSVCLCSATPAALTTHHMRYALAHNCMHDRLCTQHRTCLRSTQLDTAVTCLDYSPDGSQLVAGLGGITPKAGGFVVLRYSDFSVLVRHVHNIMVNLHALTRCCLIHALVAGSAQVRCCSQAQRSGDVSVKHVLAEA